MAKKLNLNIALMEDVNRCLLCYDAPCSKNCPGNKNVSNIIMSLRFRNFKGAEQKAVEDLKSAGECGVVCNNQMYCQRNCIRAKIDRPIKIRTIQEALYEDYLNIGGR